MQRCPADCAVAGTTGTALFNGTDSRFGRGDYADLDEVRAQNRWATEYPVEWRSVPYDLFEAESYLATANDRFLDSPRADMVILCDADTCAIARFDLLLAMLNIANPLVAGLQAHDSPFGANAADIESDGGKCLPARIYRTINR